MLKLSSIFIQIVSFSTFRNYNTIIFDQHCFTTMEKYKISIMSVPLLLVMGIIIGIGSIDNITYGDYQKTQELQMHLDKVMNELNNNNTDAAKMHLEGAQKMVSTMNEQNDTSSSSNHTTS